MFEDGSYSCTPGVALIGKVLAGKCKMNYVRATVGKGRIPEEKNPKTMTEVADYVMDGRIAAITNPVNGECQVTVQINSSDVETGFFATGILLYAEDPDEGEIPYTYLVLENGPEWIRPSSSVVGKLATFDIIAAVGEVDTVTATIDSKSIVTKGDVEKMIAQSTIQRDIVIPTTGWTAVAAGGGGGVKIEMEQEDVTEQMIPLVSIVHSDMDTARDCGMSSVAETIEQGLRLYAEKAPSKEIHASLLLLRAYGGATGGSTSTSMDIEEFYDNYVATSEDIKTVFNEVFEK